MERISSLQAYNKAIAAGVVGVIAVLARVFLNIEIQPEVEASILTLVTVFIVWLVPNR